MQISRDKKAKNQIIVLLTLTIIAYIVFVVIGMNKNNMDYLLSKRMNIKKPHLFDTAGTLNFSNLELEELGKMISYITNAVTKSNITPNDAITAIKDIKYIQKLKKSVELSQKDMVVYLQKEEKQKVHVWPASDIHFAIGGAACHGGSRHEAAGYGHGSHHPAPAMPPLYHCRASCH